MKKSKESATNEVLKRSMLTFVAQDSQHKEQMLPGILSLLECTDQERITALENWKKSRRA